MDAPATFEDQKQMIKHLNKRVQDHFKERNTLIEMNEELEAELKSKEKLLKEVSNYHKKARDEFKEETLKMGKKKEVSDTLIKSLKAENDQIKKKIGKVDLKQLLDENKTLKEGKNEKDTIIQTLKNQNTNLKKKLETNESKSSDEINNLIKEVAEFQRKNNEKETAVQNLDHEIKQSNSKLEQIEKENGDLQLELESIRHKKENASNLSEELGIAENRLLNADFDCDPCGEKLKRTEHVKNHKSNHKIIQQIMLKATELEETLTSQRLKVASDLLKLKHKEVFKNFECNCKGFCRIFHHKHNWTKSKCQELADRLKVIESKYCCKNCDKSFTHMDHLKIHIETTHVRKSEREEENVGVIVKNPSIPSGGILL